MKKRRILTALLSAVMLLSAVPFGAMAKSTEAPAEAEGKLFLDKTATLTDDGSYTINMEAFATGKTTTQTIEKGVPLDIVLVLDQSGSMKNNSYVEPLKTAVKNFIKKVEDDGRTHKVTHRIGMVGFASADGNHDPWKNTGLFDKNGNFQQYMPLNAGEVTENYTEYTNRPLDVNGEYYVKDGKTYYLMSYVDGAGYQEIKNPETSRNDIFALVDGKYVKAAYGEYTANVEAAKPTKGDGKTYYDANGNQLTWVEETKPNYVKVTSGDFNGTEYYIDTNKNSNNPNWVKLTWNGIGWDSTDSKIYVKQKPKNGIYQFKHRKTYYDAYTMENKPTGNWFLSADGKTPVTTAYEKVTQTGWNVNGTPVNTLYEYKEGAGKWQYNNKDWNGQTVYTKTRGKLTAVQYKGALVNVTDGANGQGKQNPNFAKAIKHLNGDGATRMSYGVEMGNQIFRNNPLTEQDKKDGRQRIMIVFTDGEPGNKGYADGEAGPTVNEANKTKNTYDAKVYTIGLYSSTKTEQKNFMNYLSSNYPNATYTGTTEIDEDLTGTFTPGTPAAKQDYYHQVKDVNALDKIFQSVQQDISGSTTQVDLTTDSILRDIMAEGFELTDKSVVTVSVVPGDATNAADETQIKWETPVEVLTLTNPTDGKAVTGTYKNMTIKASTHMANPEAGKKDLDTVDVTGFNYKDQYIAQAHKGSKLVVEITGVKALPTVANDQNIYTNFCDRDPAVRQSGIWAPAQDGKYNMKAPFPKRPQTYMPSKSYVVDYAKPLELPIKDVKLNTARDIDIDGYDPFASANTTITHTYGDVKMAANGNLTYTPKTMNWDGFDTFYVFGTTNNETVKAASANANGNVWAKVNVIPANNVYYEDTFTSNESNGTVGITYTGEWTEVKENPETNVGKNPGAESSGDNHGWIPVLKDETGDTDGSSHHGQFVEGQKEFATAKFTFTGTGVDVYSRTNGETGTVLASLRRINPDGSKTNIMGMTVDTVSVSSGEGSYYQIPTLSFHEEKSGEKDAQGKDIMKPLTYGTYEVEIRVTAFAKVRYEYYLDGIRVYNPAQGMDDFYADDEKHAQFVEIRDILLDANTFNAAEASANGAVFIDQIKEGQGTEVGTGTTTTAVGTYKELGPKNEVYLKNNQSITIKVDNKNNQFQIGLKSPTGKAVTAQLYNGTAKIETPLNHTADMYYNVSADDQGFITITNIGNELLSVTKLKVTNTAAAADLSTLFPAVTADEAVAAVRAFSLAPVEPEVPTEPTEPETQPTEPETEPDVDIENPTEPDPEPEKPSKPSIGELLDKIFGGILGWN